MYVYAYTHTYNKVAVALPSILFLNGWYGVQDALFGSR